MTDCIFCKIANKEISANIVFEDENVVVFPDLHPRAPIHLLIVPKTHFSDFLEADADIKNHMLEIAKKIIEEKGLNLKGYRMIVNGGGAALVSHLHFHLLGEIALSREV